MVKEANVNPQPDTVTVMTEMRSIGSCLSGNLQEIATLVSSVEVLTKRVSDMENWLYEIEKRILAV